MGRMQTPDGFAHHTAPLSDVALHYVRGGSGSPVVLLHGWSQTWYEWRHVLPVLAEQYTVIAPDLRGLGDSSKPLTGYDKRTVADDIHELVEQLGLGTATAQQSPTPTPRAIATRSRGSRSSRCC
jgi:pimeloyl-ACP methyl ester carboxylesterase